MLRTVTPAVEEPVTVDEVKADLRLIHDADDTLVAAQIASARHTVELQTGIALAEATYAWAPEGFGWPLWRPTLPLWPALVESVTYWNGNERVALESSDYRYDALRGALTLSEWFEPEVGFTTEPDAVSEDLKTAIKLRVRAEYEADADEAIKLRDAAFQIAHMHRRTLGL